MPPGVCGDGEMNPGEECDDGNLEPLDGCSEKCRLPGCGDGVAEGPEECDDGDDDDDDECLNACKQATCGDGKVFAGVEECDDGNPAENDGCLNSCLLARCGDGALHAGFELCDDGNTENNDGCLGNCVPSECGDGVLWKDVEECDDGNIDNADSCVDCISMPFRMVFLTSAIFTGNIGGLAVADLKCQTLADSAGLKGTFLAWLGDKDKWPDNRMTKATVPYLRTDYTLVAKNWDELIDGLLTAPIDRTETGMAAPLGMGPCGMGPAVHSNIASNGTVYDLKGTCSDWKSEAGSTSAGQLGMNQGVGQWTFGCPISCGYKAPIYCVQQ